MQSRKPAAYFSQPTSRAYFESRISSLFRFKIPNPELQIRESPYPEKLFEDSQNDVYEIEYSVCVCDVVNQ